MRVSNREVIGYFTTLVGGSGEIVYVEDNGEDHTSHVCDGCTQVLVIVRQTITFMMYGEQYCFEYYKCPNCGKVLLYKGVK